MHILSTTTGIEDEDGEIYAMRSSPNGHVLFTIENDYIHQHDMNIQLSIIDAMVREREYTRAVVYNDTLIIEVCIKENDDFDVDYHEFDFNHFVEERICNPTYHFVKESLAHIYRFEIEYEYQGMQECEIYAITNDKKVKVLVGESRGDDTFIRKQPYYSESIIRAISDFYDEQHMTYSMKDELTILVRPVSKTSISEFLK